MDFDLELTLVLATAVTGVIRYAQAFRERRNPVIKRPRSWLVEWSYALFPVLLIVLVLRSFVAEPFRIPSGSMMPTLLIGDLILVDKFSYGLRLPVLHHKILEWDMPQHGDVVVFRYPKNPRVDYIKRIVALPGDHVSYQGKQLEVNGEPYAQTLPEPYWDVLLGVTRPHYARYTETTEGRTHEILTDAQYPAIKQEFQVPEGHYMVMGDNRDHSSDSRAWGYVPEDHLVGRAFLVWMNYDFLLASLTRSDISVGDRLGPID